MKKNLKICFSFLMSGNAYAHISTTAVTDFWEKSDCKDYQLAPGHYLIFYTPASATGGTITLSVDGTVISTTHFAAGSPIVAPIAITL